MLKTQPGQEDIIYSSKPNVADTVSKVWSKLGPLDLSLIVHNSEAVTIDFRANIAALQDSTGTVIIGQVS
jgi:hypothetical protein